jgi:sucrose-phosphate synthase
VYLAFLNPQGNFDPHDSHWTAHPDFGGQLVYVKNLALAMGRMGHAVEIITRRIVDPEWPEFAAPFDRYPGERNVRIVRIPAGPERFLPKEKLWPYLGREWVPGIEEYFRREGRLPDLLLAHYGDGGIASALISEDEGIPFTFTAHSLGAQKMDKLNARPENLAELQRRFHFAQRLLAERVSMSRSLVNIVSTSLERFEQYGHRAYRGAAQVDDDSRFAVVPPGVALDIFDRSVRFPEESAVQERIVRALKRDIAPERLRLPSIVASSRLDPKKNHMGLMQAFAEHQEVRRMANLVIVTAEFDDPISAERAKAERNPVMAGLLEAVERHRLRGQVSMFALRGQEELAVGYRYFASTRSVFALTSLYEPFGLAPLEAMAAGLPVVVTRNGGPRETLREDGTEYGVLVDPASSDSIARGLLRLLGDRAAWERFSEAGHRRVLERYTWERTAEGYLEAASSRIGQGGWRGRSPIPIPEYFRNPTPENGPSVGIQAELYFGAASPQGETR